MEAPRRLAARSRTLAGLDPGYVRVRFLYCGICGSDVARYEGRRRVPYPESLGHEFVGEVVATGTDVVELSVGDTVTSDLNYRCGECDQCLARRSHLCRESGIGLFTNRAFAHFGDVHASYLLRVEGPPDVRFALSEPLSCVLHAKDWAQLETVDRVLVVGAGGLGVCMAFALAQDPDISAFEITDAVPDRLGLIAAAVGPAARTTTRPDGEYDVVFDLSGAESGLRLATAHVRAGGRLCTMTHLDDESAGGFLLNALTRRDVTFTVSYLNGERGSLVRATQVLGQAWSGAWRATLAMVPLELLPEAFESRQTSLHCKTIVQISPSRRLD